MAKGGYKGASPARNTSPEQYPGVWELTEQFQAQADGNWPFQADDCAPKSLRFNEGSVSNLTKTFVAAGNRRVFTWNFWVKQAKLSENNIAVVGSGSPNSIRFNADGSLQIKACGGSLTTSAKFRDFSAWYAITVSVNSTAPVASDRIKLFVNGKDFTSTLTGTSASLNGVADWNTAATHYIGKQEHNNSNMLDGLLSEVTFIDGQALSCDEFGFFDGQGIWQPKRFTGDYSSGPDWNNFISGTPYNSSRSLDKTFDGLNNTYSAAAGGATITFAPVPAITGITKVKLRVFRDASTTTDITLNGNVITSSFTAGQYTDAEFTVNNLTELKWTTDSSNQWIGVAQIFVERGGVYELLTPPAVGRNSFHLDLSEDEIGEVKDQSGLGNDWTSVNIGGPVKGLIAGITINAPSNVTLQSAEHHKMFNGEKGNYCYAHTNDATNYIQWTPTGGYPTNGHIWIQGGDGNGAGTNTMEVQINGSVVSRTAVVDNETYSQASYGWGDWHKYPVAGNTLTSLRLTGVYALIRQLSTVDDPTHAALGITSDDDVPAITDTLSTATDYFVDSPVNGNEASTGAGSERRGNYCCFNPLDKHSSLSISDGNLKVQASTTQWELARSTFFLKTGKHYWEFTWTGSVTGSSGYQMGLKTPESTLSAAAAQAGSYAFQYTTIYSTNGTTNSVVISPGSITSGDTVMFAYDADAGKMWIGVNGTWNGSGNPASGANPDWTNLPKTGLSPFAGCYGSSNTITLNAGQKAFEYNNHSGFSPIATSFLPEPTIKRGDEGLDVVLWSGDNAVSRSIKTSLSPDFAWIKVRNAANTWHHITDIVRGTPNKIYPNDVSAEDTAPIYGQVDSFDTDGFTVGDGTHASNPLADVNQTGVNYVGYAFDAGETTTTITAGSLNSSTFDQSQQWSAGMKTSTAATTSYITTGRTTSFDSGYTGQEPFNANLTDFLYGKTGIAGTWIYLEFATALTNVTSISFSTEYSCPGGIIKLNGTDVAVDKSDLGGGFVEVNVTGTIPSSLNEIAIQGHSGSSRLKWMKINGKYLIDGNPPAGKTLTRFRAKTDWNWHRISAVKVNGTTLTTGTLDNTGSVWTDPDEWKDGNADSNNATYSQSARGDWFDVTLASSIANFSELQFFMQLDSAAGSTTAIYQIELFFSDGTSYRRDYHVNSDAPNQANAQFNSWQWQNFGDLGVAINLPSNPSTVRARPEVGFSIIKYVGDHALGTSFAHGLNKKPDMIVVKNLASTDNWAVYHSALGATKFLDLNRPDGANSNTGWWYGTEPTSSVFYTGNASTTAGNTQDHFAFAFSGVEGYSKFTSYTGTNGDVFVYLGFRPRLIWFKNADATTNWLCYDTARNPSNPANFSLQLDEPNTDTTVTNDEIDILSNGFNIKATRSDLTGNGNQIIVAAWAEHPFASQARAR